VLRFNFRGVGLSDGEHDNGRGEQDDVRAALDWLTAKFARPILFAGFSFGSQVGMRACCGDARVAGLIGLGLPVRAAGRDYSYGFLANCMQPSSLSRATTMSSPPLRSSKKCGSARRSRSRPSSSKARTISFRERRTHRAQS